MTIRKSILIFVIIAACLAAYFNSLFGEFVWDDKTFFATKQYNRSFEFLPQFFVKEFWGVYDQHMSADYYRPLLALTFMIDYALWGENPLGYHLVNLIFHILNCILIFMFVEMLIKDRFIAFASALLFAVHPIHTEAVSFISNISYVLTTFFFMASLVLFIRYVQNRRMVNYLLSLLFFCVSLLIIEASITLPLILLCLDYFILSQGDLKKLTHRFLKLHLSFFIILGLYLMMRSYVVGWNFMAKRLFVETNFHNGTGNFWRLFTGINIIGMYLRTLFLPYDLKVEYFFNPSNSLFEPRVFVAAASCLLLIWLAVRNVKKYPVLPFSIAWFFVTLLPFTNIIPLGNIFSERYMYIPSIGFCLGIGFLFSWLLQKDVKTRLLNYKKSLVWLFILLILALSRVTYERNKVWENDFTLWFDAIKASPLSSRAHLNLAAALHNLGFFKEAGDELQVSLRLDPFNPDTLFTLGNNYIKMGLVEEAIAEFNKTIELMPMHSGSYLGLSAAYILKQEYDKASEAAMRALEINPYLDSARYNLALSYLQSGRIDEAIEIYKEYLSTNSQAAMAYSNLAVGYGIRGQYKEAIESDLKALAINPYLSQSSYNLAVSYAKIGLFDEAINAYERHLRINPDRPDVHLEVGQLYYNKNNREKAKQHWLKALEISGDYQPALEALELLEE